ncbi:hypothetical protein M885DRAFT_521063 [Pelagophyceae sp. CCMP2097]|nr:hypothetical protein M885DRAFT_521063 [Pelagophyceae sp. CCMP2097]|mmetsp:Transcript_2346/g.6973  ORF Transcript_2346/g.6973 Transcript_2346/m.6973 type:complete len:216 (+) Transcript_2346:142-789(+)
MKTANPVRFLVRDLSLWGLGTHDLRPVRPCPPRPTKKRTRVPRFAVDFRVHKLMLEEPHVADAELVHEAAAPQRSSLTEMSGIANALLDAEDALAESLRRTQNSRRTQNTRHTRALPTPRLPGSQSPGGRGDGAAISFQKRPRNRRILFPSDTAGARCAGPAGAASADTTLAPRGLWSPESSGRAPNTCHAHAQSVPTFLNAQGSYEEYPRRPSV